MTPKRSNEFQRLVYLLKDQYSDSQCTVTESKIFEDPVTGDDREVDICIERQISGHTVNVSVECRDSKRPVDVGWVEGMIGKHKRLPTNALVLVSRSGFTKGARQVAEDNRIDVLELDEVSQETVSEKFADLETVWAAVYQMKPLKIKVHVQQQEAEGLPAQTVVLGTEPEHELFIHDSEGAIVGSVFDLVGGILNGEDVVEEIAKKGEEDHTHFIIVQGISDLSSLPPLYLQKLRPRVLQRIDSIEIHGRIGLRKTELPLSRGRIGKVDLVWGDSELLGGSATLLASKLEDTEKGSLRVTGVEEWPLLEDEVAEDG